MHPYSQLSQEITLRWPNRSISIVAVSKFRSIEEISAVIQAGATMIGENRVQEAQRKFPHLDLSGVETHLIGHLQRNKVKDALLLFDVIQSVDSMRLAEALSAEAVRLNRVARIYLQINVAHDENKFGFSPDDFLNICAVIQQLPAIQIEGLMTIGKLDASSADTQSAFQSLKLLFDQAVEKNIFATQNPQLSMGMSGDYALALDCGSTMIRVGSRIFNVL